MELKPIISVNRTARKLRLQVCWFPPRFALRLQVTSHVRRMASDEYNLPRRD